jgi:hypothetical protein
MLRGRHSNSSSSTASSSAATGVPNTAVMPAVAPATSSVLRSAAVSLKNCANSEPIAPPVMMIGPSAPNGPPLPITMPDESGLSTATLGDILLLPKRIASMASGMPWPRIFSEPKRAISPTISPPMTGTAITHSPSVLSAGERLANDSVWKKNKLVKKRIRLSSTTAASVANAAMTTASAVVRKSVVSVAKSRRWARVCMTLRIEMGNFEGAAELGQFALVQRGQLGNEAVAFLAQVDFHLARVGLARAAFDQAGLFAPCDECHRAVRRGLQALGQLAHGGPFAAGVALDVQQQLILQRRDAGILDQVFGGAQEAAQVIAEVRQRLKVRFGQLPGRGWGHGIEGARDGGANISRHDISARSRASLI